MCILISSTTKFEKFLIVRRIQRNVVINMKTLCKLPVIHVGFSCKLNFRDRFSKNPQISGFVEIRPMEAKLFHADRQTDAQTDRQTVMPKLIVAFCNFYHVPKTK
jgi:hypothetical protein